VVVPKGHALDRSEPLTLEALSEFPIITYHEGFTGRSNIDHSFARAGLTPDIVMSAMDTDVLKAYVELGLGVGIIAATAYSAKRDAALRLIDSSHLFEPNTTVIAARRGSYLRTYAYRFIELCSPALPEKVVKTAIMADGNGAATGTGKLDAKPHAAPGLARGPGGASTGQPTAQLWRSAGNTLSRVEVKRTA
jgi:LysR family cys regulon transcriptional activator